MQSETTLIEIGTEELPPVALTQLATAFAEQMKVLLNEHRLTFTTVRPLYTPRRLSVLIDQLSLQQSDHQISRKGPSLKACYTDSGELSKAAQGFLKSVQRDIDDACIAQHDGYLYFEETQIGQKCAHVLPAIVNQALANLPIPRPMRWGTHEMQFVRPVHWVAILIGENTPDEQVEVMGCMPDRITYGHRFHAPQPISLRNADDYIEQLRSAYVLVDSTQRSERISEQITQLAAQAGGQVELDPELLEEVTNLVEWPVGILGAIEPRFLEIPKEVLVTSMHGDQRYFPVYNKDFSQLLPNFITIANIESKNPDTVRSGNERVIKPRFEDAAFFWKKDLQQSLESRLNTLKQLVFEKSLGSVFDKVERVTALSSWLAKALKEDDKIAQRAAHLCKCDLTSTMVYEFPELQGVMGRYYAVHDKEDDAVTIAIEEHYQPIQSGSPIPESAIGKIVAISDRVDTLLGIFLAGKSPTGDKDPYGIRRAAIGIIRIIIEGGLDFSFTQLLSAAHNNMPAKLQNKEVLAKAQLYVIERLRGYMLDNDALPDQFEAVRAISPENLMDFKARVEALKGFSRLAPAASLCAANKRISNLLSKASLHDKLKVERERLTEPAEIALFDALNMTSASVQQPVQKRDYAVALTAMSELQKPIDEFFDQVLVMSDDEFVKNNRLALLRQVYQLFTSVADISALQLENG